MSQTVIHSDTVYLAGQVPNDYSGDITAQTEETLAKVDGLLEEAGTGLLGLSRMVRANF